MSIDLSDPQLTAVRGAIADPNNPISWFILHYSSTAPSPSLAVLADGPSPVLPHWQEHLNDTNEDVLFGYGEIGGKGLVMVFLRDNVGGVRRARAIVHSRAVASLFPDYSALITIAHPSQLTEDLVTERLGLHHSSASTPMSKYTVPGSDIPNPLSPTAAGQGRAMPRSDPSQPPTASSRNVSQSNGQPQGETLRDSDSVPSPLRQLHNQILSDSPTRAGSPGPNLAGPISLDPSPRPELKSQGISSADYFKDENARTRKTSFGARLKHTFTHRSAASTDDNPGQPSSSSPATTHTPHSQTQSQANSPQPSSPTSPSTSRFKASSLVKAFGGKRRASENIVTGTATSTGVNGSPPTSPQVNEFGQGGYGGSGTVEYAPPVPPKDASLNRQPQPIAVSSEQLQDQDRNGSNPTSPSRTGTNGHGNGYSPQDPSPQQQNLIIPPTTRSTSLSPSPSARQALYIARQKSLTQEIEIQERFRRDQEEKAARAEGSLADHVGENGGETLVDDDDKSVRLAYDESDREDEVVEQKAGNGIVLGGVVEFNQYSQVDGDRPKDALAVPQQELSSLPSTDISPAERANNTAGTAIVDSAVSDDLALQERADALPREEDEAKARITAEEAVRAREEEVKRITEQERLEEERMWEDKRLAEEEKERVRMEQLRLEQEAEAAQEEEEARLRSAEEERIRLAEERRVREAEERTRREAEEKARSEAEERARIEAEEKTRLAEEEVRRTEERLRFEAEEKQRLRIENEQRMKWEKEEHERLVREEEERQRVERERARKNLISETLEKGKKGGGIMLRGWVTVQTYKSMTWRRRYFHLLSTEMRLFKTEGDDKPIQTIYFGSGSAVSEQYEESQVKDSFKVISDGPKGEEDFFLFTDSAEDKETVLQGLKMCLG
ncbi:hypothetical protein IAR55_006322 [Kwoniella newhampshirensis]|uniref:PH domain-containing protein n=1 Tax=Kwoniella newhampshirensis TaxID=1651941 RepID=A0AAW0YJ64_9TREE